MTPLDKLQPGDPIVRPEDLVDLGHYQAWVVDLVDRAGDRAYVRNLRGETAWLSGFDIHREGWFRASLTDEAAEELNALPAIHYERRALNGLDSKQHTWLRKAS